MLKESYQKYAIVIFLLMILIGCLIHSFFQHLYMPLDGDMAAIIVPSDWYKHVLSDPFGISALLKNEIYAAPNRFVIHWTMSSYFKTIPLLLQSFMSPVDSIYFSCAIVKISVQFFFIYLLASLISQSNSLFNKNILLASVLILPLFQTVGYNGQMGIIDNSITYTFFYAFSFFLSLLFFYPFLNFYLYNKNIPPLYHLILIPLCFITAFSGPLSPAINLLICSVVLILLFYKNLIQETNGTYIKRIISSFVQIPGVLTFYFILAVIISLYSIYIGRYNAENYTHTISLSERYMRIPYGLFFLSTVKPGFPLLIGMLILNYCIIKTIKNNPQADKIIALIKWATLFFILYILLLPLGGYRDYRPNIVRRDTLLPVIMGMIFIYGLSSYYLIRYKPLKNRKFYIFTVSVFLIIFTIADIPVERKNSCEKKSLETIASSTAKEILINSDCTVMSWHFIHNPKDSEINCQLLRHWQVMKKEQLYYQK